MCGGGCVLGRGRMQYLIRDNNVQTIANSIQRLVDYYVWIEVASINKYDPKFESNDA